MANRINQADSTDTGCFCELRILAFQVVKNGVGALTVRTAFAMEQDDLVAQCAGVGRTDAFRSLRGGIVPNNKHQRGSQRPLRGFARASRTVQRGEPRKTPPANFQSARSEHWKILAPLAA
jgi:hypothetical protein